MNKIKRMFSFLLSLTLLLSFPACGDPEPAVTESVPKAQETEAAAETEAPDSIEARKQVSDNLPDRDFGAFLPDPDLQLLHGGFRGGRDDRCPHQRRGL